ncbi:uncharacterized protein METZ01_LOCUS21801 [marine metagenome]|uniref:2Fe-2S ferredoxin-type domain-containing protein n=1 Tax=marine metagenome TaxID=408172 RepID=A0A381PS90_9ZZZZ|tara:strand:+ start:233 stop:550 length:318 start_codon:yes stop_codon:yes gene_type:complete
MTTIHVTDSEGEQHEVEAQVGLPIMETLRDLDNGVMALCGGMCSCATCHCYIEEPWAASLPPMEEDELDLLEDLESFRKEQSRLTCQVKMTEDLDGIRVEVAPDE